MLIKTATVLAILSACYGFERDERYHRIENETIAKLIFKKMELSDLIEPPRDHLDYTKKFGGKLFDLLPPFSLSGNGVSSQCQKDSDEFLRSLENFESWALRMHDASAKLTSGILNGNVNHYGDFDQCLAIQSASRSFKGQYCLAHIQPKVSSDFQYFNYLRTLSLSFENWKSTFEDPSHVMPKSSQINWALCVPSSCSFKEVEIVLAENLKNFANNSNIVFEVQVQENMCQVKEDHRSYDFGTKAAIGFIVLLLIITTLSTFYEKPGTPNQNEWFTAFSLKKNFKDLTTAEPPRGDIPSPHGVRCFNTVILIVIHKCMEVDFNPMPNRTEMSLIWKSPLTVFFRASYMYTDAFLMLSGMLTVYSFIGRLQRGQNINILKEIAARYFRVFPPMAGIMLFGTFILPLLSSGPQWPMLVTYQSELCKQTWWRSVLMIHNYFGFENICMTHTHHIGTDFGLFLTAPFLAIFLHKAPKKAMVVIVALAIISSLARFYTIYALDSTCYMLFGFDISKLYEIASYMYILPPYRFTAYGIGLILGYLLRTRKGVKHSRNYLYLGWAIAVGGLAVTGGLTSMMSVYNYKFDKLHGALYGSILPIPFCFLFAWFIYASELGHKKFFITRLASWKGFTIVTKLAYGIYLVQFAVFHYNIGRVRSPIHSAIPSIVLNANEILWILFAAVVLTLLFDYPFSNLKKLIFDSKRAAVQKEEPTLDMNSNNVNGNLMKDKNSSELSSFSGKFNK